MGKALSQIETIFLFFALSLVLPAAADLKPAVVNNPTTSNAPAVLPPGGSGPVTGPSGAPKPPPGQNPFGQPPPEPTPPGAQRIPGRPIQYPMPGTGLPGAAPLSQQGFRPEMVGGGDGGGGSGNPFSSMFGNSGHSNSFEYAPSSTNSGGAAWGADWVSVNGCTSEPGKFKTAYGSPPHAKCDKRLTMADSFRDFLDRNFGRCARQAAGRTDSNEGGTIFHAGTIGDARHQQTGSLHNKGLAIDVKAILLGSKVYNYSRKDAETQEFFTKFRACWSDAVRSARGPCMNSLRSPGCIGHEDRAHQNHMHLSLPYCPAEARAKGLYLTYLLQLFFGEPACGQDHDEEEDETNHAPIKRSYKAIAIKGVGEAKLTVEDTGGEPADGDQFMSIDLKCNGMKEPQSLEKDLQACKFQRLRYDAKSKSLKLTYLVSVMGEDGILYCKKIETKSYPVRCPKR